MWKIIPYAFLQSALLTAGQVFLKFALMRMPAFGWTREFWGSLFKIFPFSLAYPMISLSYVFGMIAAIVFFHEQVSLTRWVGVFCIIMGCCLIAK